MLVVEWKPSFPSASRDKCDGRKRPDAVEIYGGKNLTQKEGAGEPSGKD